MSNTHRTLLIALLTAAACDVEAGDPGDPVDPSAPSAPADPADPADQPGDPVEPDPAPLPAGSIPAALVGTWSDGVSSPTTFWDAGTYAGNAYEQAILFTFDERGTYGQYVYNAVDSYGCWLRTWSLFEGAAVEEGGVLALEPARGRYQIRSNCNAGSNVDREATAEEVAAMASAWSWAVDGRTLALWQDGWDAPYVLELHDE